jgi:5-dehydro-2-deoxygluconokinase
VRETLAAEGVDVSQRGDRPQAPHGAGLPRHPGPRHLSAGVLPRQLRRHGHQPDDFDAAFIASAKALLISGTHLSQPLTYESCPARCAWPRAAGTRVVLDIDYRPVLWGLTSPGHGRAALCAFGPVSAHLQTISACATWWSAPKKKSTSPAAAPTRWPPCAACAS